MTHKSSESIPLAWIVFSFLAYGCDSTSTPRQTEAPLATPALVSSASSPETLSTSPGHQLSEAEKNYMAAAEGILKTLNEQDTRVMVVIRGKMTGESTHGTIKDAVKRAHDVDNASFHGDYNPTKVPLDYQSFDKKVRQTYQLHEAAFKELLEYMRGSKTADVSNGYAAFQRAVALTNECITELNQKRKLVGAI